MELMELMRERFSVRSFADRPVEEEKIRAILEAGRIAPTACNNQPQRVLVVKSREGLEKWARCTKCHFHEQLVLIVCYHRDQCWRREYDGKPSGDVDAAIVTTHMMLMAQSLGIGSTWIMYFIPEAVRAEFALPEEIEAVSVLAMGYPAENAAPSPRHALRKELTDTVRYESF